MENLCQSVLVCLIVNKKGGTEIHSFCYFHVQVGNKIEEVGNELKKN